MRPQWAQMRPRWTEHSSCQTYAQYVTKMVPDAPAMGPQWAQMRPRWAQDGPNIIPTWLLKAPLKSLCESWCHLGVTLPHLERKMATLGPNMLFLYVFLVYFQQVRRNPQK
jgi:hypothetical protein